MCNYVTEIKLGITGMIAAFTAFWGLCGWLWVLWMLCLVIDYFTGTVAACSAGEWSSDRARKGIWSKLGCFLVILVTAALDFVMERVMDTSGLPFSYPMLLAPIVLAWYVLTEIGSILENAGALGVPLPPFLVRWIALLQKKVGKVGEWAGRERKD